MPPGDLKEGLEQDDAGVVRVRAVTGELPAVVEASSGSVGLWLPGSFAGSRA